MNYSYTTQQEKLADTMINDAYRALHALHHHMVNISGPKLLHHHLAILTMLEQSGPLSASEIASKLSLSKPQMTKFIDGLVVEKAVLRENDPEDRRRVRISITKTGISRLVNYRKLLRGNLLKKINKLDPDQVASLTQSLEQIISISQQFV
jgi:DNA-binding MarR family transcriptional regulator